MQSSVLVILGDQLFPLEQIKKTGVSQVFMAESWDLSTNYRHHKQKIALFFTAMRDYCDQLKASGFAVQYHKFSGQNFIDLLSQYLIKHNISSVFFFEIDDLPFKRSLNQLKGVKIAYLPANKFITDSLYFKAYLDQFKKPFMKTFYQKIRTDFQILMEKGKPKGGKFSFDAENRKKLPSHVAIPARKAIKQSQHVEEVLQTIRGHFPDHPGKLEKLNWPTNRFAYLEMIDEFLSCFLEKFGPYQDALSQRDRYLFHSLLSPGLNLGLITPNDILKRIHALPQDIIQEHLPSVEGFVRQIIGWREFVKGIYLHFENQMVQTNHWQHTRRLKQCWWTGATTIPIVDKTIRKALDCGYCHHIERLMVLANIFNLIGAHPHEVYRWFMEMFVDSADWVMQANVYGMGLMSDGGIFATKPYISGSNYILKMSDEQKGDWCAIWDGLYWAFIQRHRSQFEDHPRMGMMVRLLDKMSESKKEFIFNKADAFIHRTTYE